MNIKQLFGIFVLTFFTFCSISCSVEEPHGPIELSNPTGENVSSSIKDHQMNLYYFTPTKFRISGGDSDYSVTSSDYRKIDIEVLDNNLLEIFPLKLGDVTITVKDNSGNSFQFDVNVSYFEENFIVTKHEATVIGENLTEEDKSEIELSALASIPVDVGGGYKFIFTDTDKTEGEVYLYPKEFGAEHIEGKFEKRSLGGIKMYKIIFQNKTREFIFETYDKTNNILFLESLNDLYSPSYPIFRVQTSQYLTLPND